MDPDTTTQLLPLLTKPLAFGAVLVLVLVGGYRLLQRWIDVMASFSDRLASAMESHAEAAQQQAGSLAQVARDIGGVIESVRDMRAQGAEQTVLMNRLIADVGRLRGDDDGGN